MEKTLLIGNGINNVFEKDEHSWENILKRIADISDEIININKEKPFPLLYEEIYLKVLNNNGLKEYDLKSKIANIISEIEHNRIHEELINLNITNYITTNYDYTLQKSISKGIPLNEQLRNRGVVKENKYSIFRHNIVENKKFWQVHGELNLPKTINLGFEHYGGQLQHIRNYISSGTNYKSNLIDSQPLRKRIKEKKVLNETSWIDLMFTHEIHIVGLSLGYMETDLWFLLTNRARFYSENPFLKKNKIIYYCPSKYKDHNKKEIMNSNGIEVKYINKVKEEFYSEVIKEVKKSKGKNFNINK